MRKLCFFALLNLLLLATVSVGAAPAFDQASIDKYNAEFQALFDKVSAPMQQALIASVSQTLDGSRELLRQTAGDERITANIVSWNTPQISGMNIAPGFALRDDGGFRVRVPATGAWGISIPNILVRITHEHCVRYLPWKCAWVTDAVTPQYVTLTLSNLALQTGMRITGEPSGKINIDNIEEPAASYTVSLAGPTFPGSSVLTGLFDTGFGVKIKKIVFSTDSSISYVVPDKVIGGLANLATHPLTPVGGSVHYTYDPLAYDLEATISNIDDKISISDTAPTQESWELAFSPNGGTGSPGTHGKALSTADSAIWTGHYLAALAYRYKVKQDAKSLAYVDKVLKGIETLFAANGNTGLLARFAAPLDSVVGQQINADAPNDEGYGHLERGTQRKIFLLKNDQGVDVEWISHQGTNGISRDQYTGIMLGLRTAYDLVDNQGIKDRIKYLTTIALDYLIREKWIITEDRNLTNGGTPTPWVTVPYQKITMLTIGNYITGGRYQTQLDDAYGLLNIAWFSSAISSLSPLDGYYKNNLFYTNMFSYFAIEKDPVKREKMMEGVRIMDYYTGHHNNAWFNLIRASYDPANKSEYLEQANEILRKRLLGGHRYLPPQGYQKIIANNSLGYQDVLFPLDSQPRRIPVQPLYPPLRVNGEFVWQRNPYELVSFDSSSAYIEQIGGDLSLIFWMLKAEDYDTGFAKLTQPAIGSSITTASVTFQWTPGKYLWATTLYVGTSPGAYDIFSSTDYSNVQVVKGIPLTGAPVYVRLWSMGTGKSSYVDYVFNTVSPKYPEIVLPVPNTTLASSPITFQWDERDGMQATALYVGNTPGGADIYGELTNGATQLTIQGIPLTGEPIYVRLWTNTERMFKDYVYQTQALYQRPAISQMVYPAPGSAIGNSDVIFSWIKGDGVTLHWLSMGTTGPGSSNIHNASAGVLAYETVSNLPLGAGKLYVRLWSLKSGVWYYNDYTYPL